MYQRCMNLFNVCFNTLYFQKTLRQKLSKRLVPFERNQDMLCIALSALKTKIHRKKGLHNNVILTQIQGIRFNSKSRGKHKLLRVIDVFE